MKAWMLSERVDMEVDWTLKSCSLASTVLILLSGCGTNLFGSQASNDSVSASCAAAAIPNRFIVKWKDGTTSVEESESEEAFKRDVIEPNKTKIVFAEHDFQIQLEPTTKAVASVKDASSTTVDWGPVDVDASDAWTLATGQGVVVAVVDSGVDITHPQLKNQLAVNSADLPNNGIDDEGNGYIDDTYGYDFYASSGNIHDGNEGHGTHVSGVILAEHTGAANSVNGMAPNAKLLPLSFMNSNGEGSVSAAITAINYAAARKVQVINASWGGPGACGDNLQQTIAGLAAKGVLFVAAAGNGDPYTGRGLDLDTVPSYPAAYPVAGQMTVGALMQTYVQGQLADVMTGFSNYSTSLVHIMAPGFRIRSTFPLSGSSCGSNTSENDGYCLMDGTSMATPFVSGTAALLFSYRPKATVAQVKAAILAGSIAGGYLTTSGGRLSAKKALDALAAVVVP